MNSVKRTILSLASAAKFFGGLPGFFNDSISPDQARSIIADRLEHREENFINFMNRCVFSFSASPYLPLLGEAGCSFSDVEHEVKRHGIEGFLQNLRRAGVWISADEYKGSKAIRRGRFEKTFPPEAFDNPGIGGRLLINSGGSTGRPAHSHMYLDKLTERSCYDSVMFKMLDLYEAPLACWFPRLPGRVGISQILKYCKVGRAPQKWFAFLTERIGRTDWKNRVANRAIVIISRLSGNPFPYPEPVEFDDAEFVVDWISQMQKTYKRIGVQSFVSHIIRICEVAWERGLDLTGVLFIAGGEALTQAKFDRIKKVNADVISRYLATELGEIGMGCGQSSDFADYHLVSDMIAMIQDENKVEDTTARPFYYTSFVGSVPKVLLNADIGDMGLAQSRPCGCLFGDLGLDTHLTHVTNYAKTSTEALSVETAVLSRIIAEVLPAKYGGSPLDYQWVESEDQRALTRLHLRVHPRLGPLNEEGLKRDVLGELRHHGLFFHRYATLWNAADSLRIERTPPRMTAGGKLTPFLRIS